MAGLQLHRRTRSPHKVLFAIQATGNSYTDNTGVVYENDQNYTSGGTLYQTSSAIAGTANAALYNCERYGSYTYNFTLANGVYLVTYKLAEIYATATGQRVFNLVVQGTTVLANLDIYARVGGFTALDFTFAATVTNGTLGVGVASVVDNAKIGALLIRQL